MELTATLLGQLFPHASAHNIELYCTPLAKAMEEWKINLPIRVAAFLAQLEVESGSLHYAEEIASGEAYEYRDDLGNLEAEACAIAHANYTTTGRFYKGRGLLQITGFYNYKRCGDALHLELIRKPRLLLEPTNACRSAAWYFSSHGCNELADNNLFGGITKVINGGFNGAEARNSAFARNKRVLGVKI
jgi:putative chitinase